MDNKTSDQVANIITIAAIVVVSLLGLAIAYTVVKQGNKFIRATQETSNFL